MNLSDAILLQLREYAVEVITYSKDQERRQLAASALAATVKRLVDRELLLRALERKAHSNPA